MVNDLNSVQERQKKRFAFLKLLYDAKMETDHLVAVSYEGLEEKLGISHVEGMAIGKYLLNEGLIKGEGTYGVNITHKGILEVETALTRPEKATEHFPPNIYNVIVNSGNITGIQQGNTASNQVLNITGIQHQTILSTLQDAKNIIESDKELNGDVKEELAHEVNLADIESKAKKPKWERVKGYLTSAKNIAEGTSIGVALLPKIDTILKLIGV